MPRVDFTNGNFSHEADGYDQRRCNGSVSSIHSVVIYKWSQPSSVGRFNGKEAAGDHDWTDWDSAS